MFTAYTQEPGPTFTTLSTPRYKRVLPVVGSLKK